jgi:hypothetical protein
VPPKTKDFPALGHHEDGVGARFGHDLLRFQWGTDVASRRFAVAMAWRCVTSAIPPKTKDFPALGHHEHGVGAIFGHDLLRFGSPRGQIWVVTARPSMQRQVAACEWARVRDHRVRGGRP